jgi:multidrug efflux pump subunit AcrB
MIYSIALDSTLPIKASIEAIVHTLFEAVILVLIVVYIFLQSFRATHHPDAARCRSRCWEPSSLFPVLGFSVNVLTMFGLVLAIGIVVDDAIVVVEAVQHHIEHGKSPEGGHAQAMKEVSGPVVAIGLVLCAVFVPVAFMGGVTGALYQQFALTIAIAVVFSVINALTLSPGALRDAAARAETRQGPGRLVLPEVQRGFDWIIQRYGADRRRPGAQGDAFHAAAGDRLIGGINRIGKHVPGGIHSGRGQGLSVRGGRAAGGCLAAALRRGAQAGRGDRRQHRGRANRPSAWPA